MGTGTSGYAVSSAERQRTRKRVTSVLGAIVVVSAMFAGLGAVAPPASAGVDDYPSNLKSAPQDSTSDPWLFLNRECTSFVAFRMNRDGHAFSNYMTGPNGHSGHFSDAGNWAANATKIGFVVDGTPRALGPSLNGTPARPAPGQ